MPQMHWYVSTCMYTPSAQVIFYFNPDVLCLPFFQQISNPLCKLSACCLWTSLPIFIIFKSQSHLFSQALCPTYAQSNVVHVKQGMILLMLHICKGRLSLKRVHIFSNLFPKIRLVEVTLKMHYLRSTPSRIQGHNGRIHIVPFEHTRLGHFCNKAKV
mgnify:CR=1 FL=1